MSERPSLIRRKLPQSSCYQISTGTTRVASGGHAPAWGADCQHPSIMARNTLVTSHVCSWQDTIHERRVKFHKTFITIYASKQYLVFFFILDKNSTKRNVKNWHLGWWGKMLATPSISWVRDHKVLSSRDLAELIHLKFVASMATWQLMLSGTWFHFNTVWVGGGGCVCVGGVTSGWLRAPNRGVCPSLIRLQEDYGVKGHSLF